MFFFFSFFFFLMIRRPPRSTLFPYTTLFDLARRYGLPVIAIDLSQPVVRRISKEGLAALPADEQRRLVSRLAADADRERGLARDIEAAHCGLLPAAAEPGMVDAWHARNVTMARQIIMTLERAPQVVVIVGRGHQAPGGLADQVGALRPGTRQLIVDLVESAGRATRPLRAPSSALGGVRRRVRFYRGHAGVADAELGAVLVDDDAVLGDLAHGALDRFGRVAHRHENALAEEWLGLDPPHRIQVRRRARVRPLELCDAAHAGNDEPAASAGGRAALAREGAGPVRGRGRDL